MTNTEKACHQRGWPLVQMILFEDMHKLGSNPGNRDIKGDNTLSRSIISGVTAVSEQ